MRPTSKTAYARLMVLKYVVVHALAAPGPMLAELSSKWSEQDRQEFDAGCKKLSEATVKKMQEYGLWQYASPKEKNFLRSFGSRMDEYAHRAATWRMECVGILMWALGLTDVWPKLDAEMNSDLLKAVPIEKIGIFSKHPRLLSQYEISSKRDLIELWHWRVRTRQLIEEGHSLEPDESMKKAGLNSFDDIVRFSARAGHERGDLLEIMDEDFVFLGKPFRDLAPDEYHMATSIIMERHFALNWLCGMAPGNRWDETPTDT